MHTDKTLEDAPVGVIPKGIKVESANPDSAKHLADLTQRIMGADRVPPRISEATYDGGFDDSRRFISSVITTITSQSVSDEKKLATIHLAMQEIMQLPSDQLARLYQTNPNLATTLTSKCLDRV